MKRGQVTIFVIIGLVLVIAIILAASLINSPKKEINECWQDSDCACGVRIGTDECFVGNKNFVDTNPAKACPDFCSGIAGNLEVKCVENKCTLENNNLS